MSGSAELDGLTLGQRVAELRRLRGLSQKDLGVEVARSESWVSQVERDVLPVERVSVLQILADALGASVGQLRPEAAGTAGDESAPDELGALRLAMTGHPALQTLLNIDDADDRPDISGLSAAVDEVWQPTHSSPLKTLAARLARLLGELERAARRANGRRHKEVAALLNSAYLAASAAFARQDEADASWLAAPRAGRGRRRSTRRPAQARRATRNTRASRSRSSDRCHGMTGVGGRHCRQLHDSD